MNNFVDITGNLSSVINLIIKQLSLMSELLVKTDDENLDKLLKKPEDKVKFQKAIDEVLKDSSTKNITVNGREITISI